jgi:hypothetical protein
LDNPERSFSARVAVLAPGSTTGFGARSVNFTTFEGRLTLAAGLTTVAAALRSTPTIAFAAIDPTLPQPIELITQIAKTHFSRNMVQSPKSGNEDTILFGRFMACKSNLISRMNESALSEEVQRIR